MYNAVLLCGFAQGKLIMPADINYCLLIMSKVYVHKTSIGRREYNTINECICYI